jgi:hypothetical protein
MITKQIITGKEANKTLKDCIELMRDKVNQSKKAGSDIYNIGIYIRGRSYNPIEGLPMHKDVYILTQDGIKTLCYNTSHHRAMIALKLYKNNQLKKVAPEIWNNYITNGHTTCKGLLANYDNKLEKIKNIARSHADYLGNETGNSGIDHTNRVDMRN